MVIANTRSGGLSPSVPMMKASQSGHRDHLIPCRVPPIDGSSIRRILIQSIVTPVLMMVGDVIAEEPPQMGLIQSNDVIEKLLRQL